MCRFSISFLQSKIIITDLKCHTPSFVVLEGPGVDAKHKDNQITFRALYSGTKVLEDASGTPETCRVFHAYRSQLGSEIRDDYDSICSDLERLIMSRTI